MVHVQRTTDRKTLAHTNGPETEREALARVDVAGDERKVLSIISKRLGGLTCKEVADVMDKSINAISGRFTSLREAGCIERTGERREHSAVQRITDKGREELGL